MKGDDVSSLWRRLAEAASLHEKPSFRYGANVEFGFQTV
jgi:hypothetical protein